MKKYLLLGVLCSFPLFAMEEITIKKGTDRYGDLRLVQDNGHNTDTLLEEINRCAPESERLWVQFPQGAAFDSEAFQAAELTFHHADSATQYWLKDITNTIPAYSTMCVGAGAVVVRKNKKGDAAEVLVTHPKGREHTLWEAPGGGHDKGEFISETPIRECLEEAGIRCDRFGLIGIVNRDQAAPFDKRDNLHFYYLAKATRVITEKTVSEKKRTTLLGSLKRFVSPKSKVDVIHEDKKEVSNTQWMPLADLITDEAPVRGGFKEMLRSLIEPKTGIFQMPDYRQETKEEPDPEDVQEITLFISQAQKEQFFQELFNKEDESDDNIENDTDEDDILLNMIAL